MLKYSFIIHHGDFIDYIETLRQIGVVHIIEKKEGIPEDKDISQKMKTQKQIGETIKFLKTRKLAEKNNTKLNAPEIIHKVQKLRDNIELKNSELQTINKKRNQLKPWGHFSWETIERLKAVGKNILFYSCNRSKYKPAWKNEFDLFEIGRLESNIYFIIICDKNEAPEIQADILKLPTQNLEGLNAEAKDIENKIETINQELDALAENSIETLSNYSEHTKADINFKKVKLNASDKTGSKIKLIEGWLPVDKEEELIRALENKGAFYIKSEPGLRDHVPVLLKNNAFTKLFELVGSLYSLPNYREIDLTPFFAPFFMLFFGFCLGDAGYGLLLMIATLILRIKAKPNMKPIWTLGFFFGLATVIMGIIGGTFFGVMLVDLNFSWIETIKGIMLDQNQLMAFAVILGIVQIVFGICLKAARTIKMNGLKYGLSIIGWLVIILGVGGSFALGHFDVISQSKATPIMIGTGAVGGILALFFNSPGKNLLVNFGLGLWDTYSIATGLLGDVLSYIRLFALGLSSAILGNVFNQLAFELTGNTPVISQLLTIIILLLGHSINFFMAALGAFVHPLRLTFVEFFKNTGFSGGGIKYEPFRDIEKVKY